MGSGKHRWKLSLYRSPSTFPKRQIPNEFTCPILSSIMSDPVIVSSGHSFERSCVQACKSLAFNPILPDGSTPDFSTVIPNLALKSAILNWCSTHSNPPPKPIDFHSALQHVRSLQLSQDPPKSKLAHTQYVEINRQSHPTQKNDQSGQPNFLSSSSLESVSAALDQVTLLSLPTRPSSYSSCSSSSDAENLSSNSTEEEELLSKLRSSQVIEREEAVASLRKMTKTKEQNRVQLCTPGILSALRSLITSRHAAIQVNSTAALVNLSLESQNKVRIVRSGIVPPLIDVLKGGSAEAQDHAAGALFSLALDDQNKTAIGVLGALPPLLHALRSESERTRHDSALALYHLTLVQSNRAKLVKLGAVQPLMGMIKSGHMTGRIILILCNMAGSAEARAAMLDAGSVDCVVGMLSEGKFESEWMRESCVTALYGLSHGGLRFKVLAKEANAEEALKKQLEIGTKTVKEKAKMIMEVLKKKLDDDEEIDWEELLDCDEPSQTR